MLEGSFVINMTPFFKHSEPHDSATTIRLSNEHDHLDIPMIYYPIYFSNLQKTVNDFTAIMV